MLTGFGNIAQAVSIVHELRAFWFLEKPADPSVLGTLLERAIEYGSLVRETERLQRELGYHGILGDLGSHLIDLARWLNGDIVRVAARLGLKRFGLGLRIA